MKIGRKSLVLIVIGLAILLRGYFNSTAHVSIPTPLSKAFYLSKAQRHFKKIQLFSGGGFQSAVFLGYSDGLRKRGWLPDLVIGTCGGAFAALLTSSLPNPEDRIAFLRSPEFYEELRRVVINKSKTNSSTLLSEVTHLEIQAVSETPFLPLPNVFRKEDVALWLPLRFNFSLAALSFSASGVRSIIVASHFLFGPGEEGTSSGDASRKWYREAYFTDAQTARLLENRVSTMAALYPQSAIDSNTEVHTDWTLGDAARASMADIRYIQPVQKGDQYYGGGFLDLFPVELALELGQEVVAVRPTSFSHIENVVMRTSFGVDGNERFRYLRERLEIDPEVSKRVHWLDTSDLNSIYSRCGMNPHLVIGIRSRMDDRIPGNYAEYLRRVDCLYNYGLEKAQTVDLGKSVIPIEN